MKIILVYFLTDYDLGELLSAAARRTELGLTHNLPNAGIRTIPPQPLQPPPHHPQHATTATFTRRDTRQTVAARALVTAAKFFKSTI